MKAYKVICMIDMAGISFNDEVYDEKIAYSMPECLKIQKYFNSISSDHYCTVAEINVSQNEYKLPLDYFIKIA